MSASPCSNRVLLFTAAISLLIFSCVATANAQRLPSDIIPEHYKLVLTPDLKAATFAGHEEITVKLAKPIDAITLNALELKFLKVTTEVDGMSLPARVSLDDKKQQATLTFPRTLPAGTHTIAIDFTGILNGQLRGFYLSKTSKRNYAVTQFEQPMLAAPFPRFDEPAFKATLTSPDHRYGDTAISNTRSNRTRQVQPQASTRSVLTTPKMSTYLVAFLVGDFQCVVRTAVTALRSASAATPDKVRTRNFAVDLSRIHSPLLQPTTSESRTRCPRN